MTHERRMPMRDGRIPPGYRIDLVEQRGYDSPDRYYEAFEGTRSLGTSSFLEAIEKCEEDAERVRPKPGAVTWHSFVAQEAGVVGHKTGCNLCGKTVEADGGAVQWECVGCHRLVCREHTLTVPGLPEYYEQTLCSYACWEAVGRPDE